MSYHMAIYYVFYHYISLGLSIPRNKWQLLLYSCGHSAGGMWVSLETVTNGYNYRM